MDVCMERRNEPLLLRPAGKDYLWGGKRLNDEYVRPFDQTDSLPEKIIIVSDLFHFFQIPDTIYIKMIKWQTSVFIFLDNGKRRAVYRFCNSKTCCHSLCEHGFSNSQIACQCRRGR